MSGERKPVVGLRGPREEVAGLVYLGRMVDKVRLERAGKLPEEYRANLGQALIGRAVNFWEWVMKNYKCGWEREGRMRKFCSGAKVRADGEMRGSGKFGASIYRRGVGGTR